MQIPLPDSCQPTVYNITIYLTFSNNMYHSNRDALPIYQPSDGRPTGFGREPLAYRDNGDDRAQMPSLNPPRLPPISSLLSSLPPGQVEDSQGFDESYRSPSQGGPRSPLALDRPMYLHQQQRSPRELEMSFKQSQSPRTAYSSGPATPMSGTFATREGSVAAHHHGPFSPHRYVIWYPLSMNEGSLLLKATSPTTKTTRLQAGCDATTYISKSLWIWRQGSANDRSTTNSDSRSI